MSFLKVMETIVGGIFDSAISNQKSKVHSAERALKQNYRKAYSSAKQKGNVDELDRRYEEKQKILESEKQNIKDMEEQKEEFVDLYNQFKDSFKN